MLVVMVMHLEVLQKNKRLNQVHLVVEDVEIRTILLEKGIKRMLVVERAVHPQVQPIPLKVMMVVIMAAKMVMAVAAAVPVVLLQHGQTADKEQLRL